MSDDEPTLVERARKEASELDDEEVSGLLRELADQVDDYDQLFDMQYKADMRGIALWREANPGNELALPDRGKLIFWLLQEITRMGKLIAEDKQTLFEAGKLAGQLHLELSQVREAGLQQAAKTTLALEHIEQAHQAIHKGQRIDALHCVARAMEALA